MPWGTFGLRRPVKKKVRWKRWATVRFTATASVLRVAREVRTPTSRRSLMPSSVSIPRVLLGIASAREQFPIAQLISAGVIGVPLRPGHHQKAQTAAQRQPQDEGQRGPEHGQNRGKTHSSGALVTRCGKNVPAQLFRPNSTHVSQKRRECVGRPVC
ncbi:hypothetical protein EYF80_048205 [Liparis tanakae]|uniref:Uncharacterized protein n=1 Tax=Liparis tanakae TaxID=230148 RepID=A0A4Z2FKT9_9TELE|nr:hypothetical protein EYF80_048205 [Liparis tanakae]